MSNDLTTQWIEKRSAILAASTDRMKLEVAATELASADDPAALDTLAKFLPDQAFLARLDDLADPGAKLIHLAPVLSVLIEHASPEIVPLCLALVNDPVFLADPDRKVFLLQALAAVSPMNEETVNVFRQANLEGYFNTSACLLASNSSPLALALFLSMMLHKEVDAETRAELLHVALLPIRNRIPIMEAVGRLVAANPEDQVRIAAVESIFDFDTKWRRGHPQPPPPLRLSTTEELKYLLNLGAYLKKHFSLPQPLRDAIDRTTETAKALLARRGS